MRTNSNDDEDDGLFDEANDDDDDDDSSDEDIAAKSKPSKKRKKEQSGKKKKKKKKKSGGGQPSWIDDAAEESGDEGSGDDEDEDDENENDYVNDGFVVDETEVEEVRRKKKGSGDLEDSDDDDGDSDADSDDGMAARKKRFKKSRVRKMRAHDVLADEDLDLIREARGEQLEPDDPIGMNEAVTAQSGAELSKNLFYDSGGEEGAIRPTKPTQKQRVERYDEDGMDDFIDDDIGDQGQILASERRGGYDDEDGAGVSEAQLNEASEIFGTDYLEFMANDDDQNQEEDDLFGKNKYRERGVGVDLMDSDEDISDDDDDLFDDDDDADGVSGHQREEAVRLRQEKRKLARMERKKQKAKKMNEKRKAQLRRAFEPVQLVENFCTDRDDEIRKLDAPERFFDWKVPYHGGDGDEITLEEEEEAIWIMSRITDIAKEFYSVDSNLPLDEQDKQQSAITNSIVHALRFMHKEKLEPAFIKRYRQDTVVSPAVRNNLYNIMDEDAEWERMTSARDKVASVLSAMGIAAQNEESVGSEAGALQRQEEELVDLRQKLDASVEQEASIKAQIEELGPPEEETAEDDDDDDDELFGDDDDEKETKKAKKEERQKLTEHLSTVQALVQERAERISTLEKSTGELRLRVDDSDPNQPAKIVANKICRENLWNADDMTVFLSELTDSRHIVDVSGYLNLIKEGNEAIRKKDNPALEGSDKKPEGKHRSRRFDRDFYRTCVSEGLRNIAYRFLLSPHRVGIKMEDSANKGSFDFSKKLPGEENSGPDKWVAPVVADRSPIDFANELVGSGELALLSSSGESGDVDSKDPLRGCRTVAAMELAFEPRVRRHLRSIYRRYALLSTRPTKKGKDVIDAFHDYYGLHLIKFKPIKHHFPMDEKESQLQKAGRTPQECNEIDKEAKRVERDSCMQYLNILKAEKTGDVEVNIHLPLENPPAEWYSDDEQFKNKEMQMMSLLMKEIEDVYLPMDGDSHEWNEERQKVIRQAVTTFLLPQFEAETRRELREAATKVGVSVASESLYDMAMEGPYRPQYLAHSENRFLRPTGDLPMVGICCAQDNKDATYMASVTEDGVLNDHLAIPSGTRIDSGKYREKVITFLLQSRPAAVLVGTSGGFSSRMMHRRMNEIIAEAIQRWNNRDIQGEDEDEDQFEARREKFRQLNPVSHYDDYDEDVEWNCNAELIDDSVAQLFGRSIRSKKEFAEQAVNLKIAISTARYAKDPLAELTYTWSVASDAGMFGAEMLYLNIHPMQQLMPKTQLLRQYERVLCEVVAEVGVDINASCTHDHQHGLLSFVAGLGPRKAANIKQSISQMGGMVEGRRKLLQNRFIGPTVFNNCVAFVRIVDKGQLSDQFINPLDNTRLHPDVYHRNNWAIKIAIDALERNEDDSRNKESASIKAIRDIMDNSSQEVARLYDATKKEWESLYGPTFNVADWDPKINVPSDDQWRDKVEELDLDAFAEMIEHNDQGKWHSHLKMIKWEFRLPFVDPRKPMAPLAGDRLFRLITGETDQSLRPGKEVTGKVVRNGDFGSRVKLEGDIPAFIPLRNLADEHVESADDIVTSGTVVTAVVTEVKKDHMSVDLSLKMEDFRKSPSSWERPQSLPILDELFDQSGAAAIEEKKNKEREARLEAMHLSISTVRIGDGEGGTKKKMNRVAKRACAHPAFRNAVNNEVQAELKEAGAAMVGEALVRPSSKSSDSLAIHWVVKEGCIKVIEVIEEDKDTDASIGNILKIKNETYGSIDELLGRYIAPMNDFVEELTNHRKFLDMQEDDLDDQLKRQKTQNPSGVFYNICWMEMHPGYASLRFVLSNTPRHHPIGISPNGYVWGTKTYNNLDKLLNDFKKNPRGSSTKRAAPSKPPPPKPTVSSTPKPSRWGDRPPAPPTWNGGQPPPPQAPPVQAGWAAASASNRPPPPPPNMAPPPPANFRPPPPPAYGRPPPPPGPPGYQPPPPAYYQ